ncbi:hypothetical protein U3A58_05910 [Algoriphagus sp. C2-6-M1]|uniref:hypothetical protein n=1 Tax=Algoriphagus persicinus TaxID=3108754 RepID=UPI002B371969|nr:hypothetical protein [Algoriphagus sp. C2-6-M1]MEB2779924.1 hypothetical protein [Algoriphagus sp. C2-6-M1]
MLHQLAPHAHHQHEIEVLSDHHADDHKGTSHEHHSDEKSPLDFLSLLFANHAHSQQLVDHSPTQVQSSETHVEKNREQKTIAALFHIPLDEVGLILKQSVPEALGMDNNTYFVSIALRGPPL